MLVDAHLHLWDVGRHRYEWRQRPENSRINCTFGFADFAERAVAAGVDRDAILGGTARACDGLDSA